MVRKTVLVCDSCSKEMLNYEPGGFEYGEHASVVIYDGFKFWRADWCGECMKKIGPFLQKNGIKEIEGFGELVEDALSSELFGKGVEE